MELKFGQGCQGAPHVRPFNRTEWNWNKVVKLQTCEFPTFNRTEWNWNPEWKRLLGRAVSTFNRTEWNWNPTSWHGNKPRRNLLMAPNGIEMSLFQQRHRAGLTFAEPTGIRKKMFPPFFLYCLTFAAPTGIRLSCLGKFPVPFCQLLPLWLEKYLPALFWLKTPQTNVSGPFRKPMVKGLVEPIRKPVFPPWGIGEILLGGQISNGSTLAIYNI